MGDTGEAPAATLGSGANNNGSRYLGLGARMVRVVTTAGVCVMGLFDLDGENQEKPCDASIAGRVSDNKKQRGRVGDLLVCAVLVLAKQVSQKLYIAEQGSAGGNAAPSPLWSGQRRGESFAVRSSATLCHKRLLN